MQERIQTNLPMDKITFCDFLATKETKIAKIGPNTYTKQPKNNDRDMFGGKGGCTREGDEVGNGRLGTQTPQSLKDACTDAISRVTRCRGFLNEMERQQSIGSTLRSNTLRVAKNQDVL